MSDTKICIIPEPLKISAKEGKFNLNSSTKILTDNLTRGVAKFFTNFLQEYKRLNIIQETYNKSKELENVIIIEIGEDIQYINKASYSLRISEKKIHISATEVNGIFYGIQSLIQIIIQENMEESQVLKAILIPCVEISDTPRFKWRGFMLDEARHFFGKKVIKKLLDIMALLKFNIFHWHLTDDQGWRVEIKKYPRLIEIGSKRKGTMLLKRGYFTGLSKTDAKFDNIPVEGHYSQDDLREIIQYAKERFITIVPEIDFPGHVTAALASYPDLSCTGGPFEVSKAFGIHKEVFCIGNDKVFEFCQNVLNEIIKIFPSKFIHMGGDEVPTRRWKKCVKCKARIEKEGLSSANELQNYFTSEIYNYIKSKGRILIGWNEILNKDLDIEAICQYWINNFDIVLEHIRLGRKVIMSEMSALYLNYPIELTPLQKTYEYDPIPSELEKEYIENVLGLEACLWTEFIKKENVLAMKLFPRILAVGEIGWISKSNRNFEWFNKKVTRFGNILKFFNINYGD